MEVQRNGDVLRSGAPPVVSHCFPVRRCMLPAAFIGDIARRGWKGARCIFKENRNNYDPLAYIIINVYQTFYRSFSFSSPSSETIDFSYYVFRCQVKAGTYRAR